MKPIYLFSGSLLLCFALISFVSVNSYRDGIFRGVTKSIYTAEDFYGDAKITIENNLITKIDFKIIDSALHEVFDSNYENHYVGNPVYIQQCRTNWAALKTFPDTLLKYQDINEVDAVTGATWAHNLFKSSVIAALEQAKEANKLNLNVRNSFDVIVSPNPFENQLTCKIGLSDLHTVKISVFNTEGKIINQMVRSYNIIGEKLITLNNFPSKGRYFLVFETNNMISCQKVIKL